MTTSVLFEQLGLSLLVGLLVGLQRERVESPLAGFRTFPLVTLLGTLCAFLAGALGGWVLAAGFLGVVAMAAVGNQHRLQSGQVEAGLTTEFAMMVMFAVGAYLHVGPYAVGVAVGGTVAVLLQFKPELHGFARALTDQDVRAVMQFVLVSFIVLPVLPDRAYGPFGVLNPHQVWLMVVLIVGISLAGYVVYKLFGERAGIVAGGVLGGLVSSTATTVSYARRTCEDPGSARLGALVVLIASTVLYPRVLFEMQVVAPEFAARALLPMLVMLVVSISLCVIGWFRVRGSDPHQPEQENPAQLRPAVLFGLLYALVLFGVAAARSYFGSSGMFLIAGISGLVNVDVITLSTARLVHGGRLDAHSAWKMVMLAVIANFVFKAGIVAVIGRRRMLWEVAPPFLVSIAAGAALMLWG